MTLLLFVTIAATTHFTNWLPAPASEFDAFTKHGDVRWTNLGRRADGANCSIAVGTVGDRVAFVVIFVRSPGGEARPHPIRARSSYPVRSDGRAIRESITATLNLSEYKSLRLPIRARLIEMADGTIRLSDRQVTLAEVKEYMDSKDIDCSLDDLIRFVDARRKGPGK